MGRVVLGMIGLGTVGTGVVRLLTRNRHLSLKKVAVKDPAKSRDIDLECEMTGNVADVIDDPEIEVLIEVMGSEHPALDYLEQAIEKHKHIVTANKEVLAKHGPRLFELARKKGVAIFCEASVAGGIPLISTIHQGLEANQFSSVTGILNGTTNFILSQMEETGASFDAALNKAQRLGFAEADPTNDVDGYDVAYKLSILSALAYGKFVNPESICTRGIRLITSADIEQAARFDYRIKLLGLTCLTPGNGSNRKLSVRVEPSLVPLNHPLASVSGSQNGILVAGDAVGEIMMVGPGAGQMPTASAVVGDTMNLASALNLPDFATYFQPEISTGWAETEDPGEHITPYYLNLTVKDTAGVIGSIGTIFGNHNISIKSIIQKGTEGGSASVIIFTHAVRTADMEAALGDISASAFLEKLTSCITIFDPAADNA